MAEDNQFLMVQSSVDLLFCQKENVPINRDEIKFLDVCLE